jgi:hypothetical protein
MRPQNLHHHLEDIGGGVLVELHLVRELFRAADFARRHRAQMVPYVHECVDVVLQKHGPVKNTAPTSIRSSVAKAKAL